MWVTATPARSPGATPSSSRAASRWGTDVWLPVSTRIGASPVTRYPAVTWCHPPSRVSIWRTPGATSLCICDPTLSVPARQRPSSWTLAIADQGSAVGLGCPGARCGARKGDGHPWWGRRSGRRAAAGEAGAGRRRAVRAEIDLGGLGRGGRAVRIGDDESCQLERAVIPPPQDLTVSPPGRSEEH